MPKLCLPGARHKNCGPKFGIRLLPGSKVKPIESLKDYSVWSSQDLLHIPTPWHNSILEIEGEQMLYAVKSKVVLEAIQRKDFVGGWVAADTPSSGGRYLVRKDVSPQNQDSGNLDSIECPTGNSKSGSLLVAVSMFWKYWKVLHWRIMSIVFYPVILRFGRVSRKSDEE